MTTHAVFALPASSLGATIEEKTRALLGWSAVATAECLPPAQRLANTPSAKSPSRKCRVAKARASIVTSPYPFCPMNAARQSAADVPRQQLTPPPSPMNAGLLTTDCRPACAAPLDFGPLPISPVSPNARQDAFATNPQVFDRLRHLLPSMPADRNACNMLVQIVSTVVDLEHRLEQLKEKNAHMRSCMQLADGAFVQSSTAAPPVCSVAPELGSDVPDDLLHLDVSAFKCLVTKASPTAAELFASGAGNRAVSLDLLTVDTTLSAGQLALRGNGAV